MKFYIGMLKQVNKILEELQIIEMRNGQLGHVFWDGLYKVYIHPFLMELILILLIEKEMF